MTRQEILAVALDRYGQEAQMDVCIEEMSELTKEIIKSRRTGRGNIAAIIEEIADVQIMLDQMRMIFGPTDDDEARKVHRLKSRLGL